MNAANYSDIINWAAVLLGTLIIGVCYTVIRIKGK